jgi:ABC-type phosphate transport system substrate-binding protein
MNNRHVFTYPEGDDLQAQTDRRHRRGLAWRLAFMAATMVGILTLVALLYNILNQTFGLVVVENRVDPVALVRDYQTSLIVQAAESSSEDDSRLATAVAGDPNAAGFFGYAYFQANAAGLRALPVEGALPGEDGYPLSRPLFLYTAAEIGAAKPQVAAFIHYYLAHAGEVLAEEGYFAADAEAVAATREAWLAAAGLAALPAVNPADYEGTIVIGGSSTLLPLTRRIAEMFIAGGFPGAISLQGNGSSAGFAQLCGERSADINQASRPMTRAEIEACRANRLQPQVVRVANDALTVAVNGENSFAGAVSAEQLAALFTTADRWSDVNSDWPESPIIRYVPGAASGTLDYFAGNVFDEELDDLPQEALVGILRAHVTRGLGRRLEREQRFHENVLVFDTVANYQAACAAPDAPSGCTAPPRSQNNVYHLVLDWVVRPDVVQTWSLVESLFNRAAIADTARRNYPGADLQFRTWLTADFITSPQAAEPELAGVRTAILGSLWVIAITIAFSFPIGVGAAIYLEEYARPNAINRFIQTNINNLAGVPSIIYGMLGLAIFVRLLVHMTSGAAFGAGKRHDGKRAYDPVGRSDAGAADPADHHHQRAGSDPGSAELAADGKLWAGRHEVADNLVARAAERAAGDPDGHDPGDVAGDWRDGAAGRHWRLDLHHRRSGKPVFQVHDPTDPDLPVDLTPAGGVPQYCRGGDSRPARAAVELERHRRRLTQSF